jgi:16S rRNA (uracil1498-N3)-methyltransferase
MSRAHHRRFFVSADAIEGGIVRFSPVQAHQILRVLRLTPGDAVTVFDGTGRELDAELVAASPREARARVRQERRPRVESGIRLTLAQVVPRGPQMDLIVAKATELGISRILCLEAEHSVRRGSGQAARWGRLAAEAAEQSGRVAVPEILEVAGLPRYLAEREPAEPLLLCHDREAGVPLAALCGALSPCAAATVLVGSEGGFSPEEVARCEAAGARLAWLGPRRLRSETAALAALAVIQACLGDAAHRIGSTDGCPAS